MMDYPMQIELISDDLKSFEADLRACESPVEFELLMFALAMIRESLEDLVGKF